MFVTPIGVISVLILRSQKRTRLILFLHWFTINTIAECVKKLLQNAYIKRFIMGKNNTRVTFDAEILQNPEQGPCTITSHTKRAKVSTSMGPYQPPSPVNIVGSLLDTWSFSTESLLSPLSSPRCASSVSSPRANIGSFLSSPRHHGSGIPASPRGREPPTVRRPHLRQE